MPYTLDDLARRFNARVEGDVSQIIEGVGSLRNAGQTDISFYTSPRHQAQLAYTNAAAVILREKDLHVFSGNRLLVSDPLSCFAKIATLLNPKGSTVAGIHPSAVVDQTAKICASASIGANSFIGPNVLIGERVEIGPNCNLIEDVSIGDDSHLACMVTVYSGSQVGARCTVHAGAVIGADGFGLVNDDGKWLKVPQLGRVRVGDDVDIGANTCIDRGALDDTVIGDGVKLDNQIQIGHNVTVGDHTVMAGCVGVAGSVTIGKRCMLGGRVSIFGHLEITDDVIVTATSVVTRSLHTAGTYSSVIPTQQSEKWQRNVARLHRLDKLYRRVMKIDEQVALLVKGEELG